MTKAEIGMLVLTLLFGASLLFGMRLVKIGAIESMTFWTVGVMGLMVLFGLIAAFGIKNLH